MYKDKLQDKDVYSNFIGLVNRAKQFASQEMAQAVDEWKAQLEKVKEPRRSREVEPNNQCRRLLLTMEGGAHLYNFFSVLTLAYSYLPRTNRKHGHV